MKELLINENSIGNELTLKQEKFCRLYTQNKALFGNSTLSYAEAYNYELDGASRESEKDEKGNNIPMTSEFDRMYNVCSACSSRLLRNDKIDNKIRELLNEMLLDKVIDAELIGIIMKGEKDSDRIAGIREYNKLKQRIIEKSDITSGGEKILIMPQELIEKNAVT